MNTTQSPTTPQPHRRHRTHIPLSLRSIAMKAVSPSPANRRPIPTSSQPLCRAVPASPSNANASYRFRCGGTSPLSSPRRPAVRRKPRARAGPITRGRTGVLVRDAYAISWGHGSGVADPGPDHRDATIALPWRTYRAGGHSARKPLGEGVRELAGRVVLDHQALECLEILPMEILQIFHVEAFAVLAEMGSAT
jgi:hypothetical protein